jgi:hypothetical protein
MFASRQVLCREETALAGIGFSTMKLKEHAGFAMARCKRRRLLSVPADVFWNLVFAGSARARAW